MARTILEIAQEAAERDATAPAPAALFGTNNRIAKILRGAAKDTMREYLRSSRYKGLSEFQSTWVFATQPGRYAYPLPPDFLRIIPCTENRNGWSLGLVGPVSPHLWAEWLYGGSATTTSMGWRIRNNVIWIEPVPSVAELITIDYITSYPVVSEIREGDYNLSTDPLQTYAPIVPRDGHLSLPDDSLVSEVDTTDALYDDDDAPGFDVGTYGSDPHEVLRRLNPMSSAAPLPQVRRPEFTADTDLPAFEDDFILSIGMTFRLRRALGMSYAEHAAEYEAEMESKSSSDAGGPRDFLLGRRDDDPIEQVPIGDSRWIIS